MTEAVENRAVGAIVMECLQRGHRVRFDKLVSMGDAPGASVAFTLFLTVRGTDIQYKTVHSLRPETFNKFMDPQFLSDYLGRSEQMVRT